MLYYVPLEPLKERYTMQWSAPKTGWVERGFIKNKMRYKRIEGDPSIYKERPEIKQGVVLDAVGRSLYAMSQIKELLLLLEKGKLTGFDHIFFDDFWTPGMECLQYAFETMKSRINRPQMHAFLHAQSVDEFDFTAKMDPWMRSIEQGYARMLVNIFVCCPSLQKLVIQGLGDFKDGVHVTGHPFSSEEVMSRMPAGYQEYIARVEDTTPNWPRQNKVVFSSRFDREKDPMFFLEVVDKYLNDGTTPEALFVICTSAKKIRSNYPRALDRLGALSSLYPERVILKEGLSKEEYYAELASAKVQMNTANQDWVAITLLEASVAGCFPLYPYFRSFPETFLWNHQFMYEKGDVEHAVDQLATIMGKDDLWTREEIIKRSWIHTRFDLSMDRICNIIKGIEDFNSPDPFDRDLWGSGPNQLPQDDEE